MTFSLWPTKNFNLQLFHLLTSRISLILCPPFPMRGPHWLFGTSSLIVTGGTYSVFPPDEICYREKFDNKLISTILKIGSKCKLFSERFIYLLLNLKSWVSFIKCFLKIIIYNYLWKVLLTIFKVCQVYKMLNELLKFRGQAPKHLLIVIFDNLKISPTSCSFSAIMRTAALICDDSPLMFKILRNKDMFPFILFQKTSQNMNIKIKCSNEFIARSQKCWYLKNDFKWKFNKTW